MGGPLPRPGWERVSSRFGGLESAAGLTLQSIRGYLSWCAIFIATFDDLLAGEGNVSEKGKKSAG